MAIQKDHSYDAYYFMANNKVDSLRNEMAALKLWDSFLTKPICKWHAWSEKSSLETFISSQLDIYIYNKVRRVGSDNFCNPFIRKILQNQVSSTTIRYFAAKQPSQKLGMYTFRKKSTSNIEVIKKNAPKLIFLIEKKPRKIRIIFDIKNHFESQILAYFEKATKLCKAFNGAYIVEDC